MDFAFCLLFFPRFFFLFSNICFFGEFLFSNLGKREKEETYLHTHYEEAARRCSVERLLTAQEKCYAVSSLIQHCCVVHQYFPSTSRDPIQLKGIGITKSRTHRILIQQRLIRPNPRFRWILCLKLTSPLSSFFPRSLTCRLHGQHPSVQCLRTSSRWAMYVLMICFCVWFRSRCINWMRFWVFLIGFFAIVSDSNSQVEPSQFAQGHRGLSQGNHWERYLMIIKSVCWIL